MTDDTARDTEGCAAGGPLPQAVQTRTPLLLTRAGDTMLNLAMPGFDEMGITGRDYFVLAVLHDDQPTSQLEIANLCGKAPAMVVAIIDDLERLGLVARGRDPEDRRRSIVTLTAEGKAMLERADRHAATIEAQVLGSLDPAEQDQLQDLLRRALLARADADVAALA